MRILDCSELDMTRYNTETCTRNKKKNSPTYRTLVCAFDIETSVINHCGEPHSIMYVWQFAIEQDCYIGRTWAEFSTFCGKLVENSPAPFVVWTHNLSYEFEFVSAILNFKPEDVFTVKSRRVLKATTGMIEFRCSYLQSGTSLDKFLQDMQVEHKKVKWFDYNKTRYPWTELTPEEMEYITHDVIGLTEAIHKRMELRGDNLATIPMTATGYCRQEAKQALSRLRFLDSIKPDIETYMMEHMAFRGGDTHANRFKAGFTLKNVTCYDRSSSYPDVICNCLFPMSKFETCKNPSIRNVSWYLEHNYCFLITFTCKNLRLRDRFCTCPYIPKSKCQLLYNPICDNGRVLQADVLTHTCTDIDWMIILDMYDFDGLQIDCLKYARYGKLPQYLVDLVRDYYRQKTELKNVDGMEMDYGFAKARLNSFYGMMVQALIKNIENYNPVTGWDMPILLEDIENRIGPITVEELAKFNENLNRTKLNYAWGVWVTAHARERLIRLIRICGDDVCYWDTDSVFYEGTHDFTEYNESCIKDSTESGAFATDKNGKVYYMGTAEQDKYCLNFKTLGSKKYIYTDAKGFHITVAGVPKKEGAEQMVARFARGEDEQIDYSNCFEQFKIGLVFHSESFDTIPGTGKLQTLYHDNIDYGTIEVDGHVLKVTRNVVLLPADYQLGITDEYAEVLNSSRNMLEYLLTNLQ